MDSQALKRISDKYDEFTLWTHCDVYVLNVDDEDINREVSEIETWLFPIET